MGHKKRKEWETNRDMAKKARHAKFYCWGCDGCLVGVWEKCGYCGKRNGPKRNKKAA